MKVQSLFFIIVLFCIIMPSKHALGDEIANYLKRAGADQFVNKKLWPNGNIAVLETDTNGDGKPDVFDYFDESGRLIKRTRDRNFDGKIDEITTFPNLNQNKIITERDNKFNGAFNFHEEREIQKNSIVVTKSVKDSKGNLKPQEIIRIPSKQADDEESDLADCHCQLPSASGSKTEHLKELTSIFLGIGNLGPLQDGFYSTNYNFKVQKSCVDKMGAARINQLLQSTLSKGIACEWALGSAQAHLNAHKLISLLYNKANPIKLFCDEGNGDEGEAAVSTGHPSDKDFPAISLNIKSLFKVNGMSGNLNIAQGLLHPISLTKLQNEFESTIFHESTENFRIDVA